MTKNRFVVQCVQLKTSRFYEEFKIKITHPNLLSPVVQQQSLRLPALGEVASSEVEVEEKDDLL
jgi:hypothetical protein